MGSMSIDVSSTCINGALTSLTNQVFNMLFLLYIYMFLFCILFELRRDFQLCSIPLSLTDVSPSLGEVSDVGTKPETPER